MTRTDIEKQTQDFVVWCGHGVVLSAASAPPEVERQDNKGISEKNNEW